MIIFKKVLKKCPLSDRIQSSLLSMNDESNLTYIILNPTINWISQIRICEFLSYKFRNSTVTNHTLGAAYYLAEIVTGHAQKIMYHMSKTFKEKSIYDGISLNKNLPRELQLKMVEDAHLYRNLSRNHNIDIDWPRTQIFV